MLLTFRFIFKGVVPASFSLLHLCTGGSQVHMSLHHMPVQPGVQPGAAFQVYLVAHLEQSQIRFQQGFLDGGDRISIFFYTDHGKTYSVVGDTLVDFQLVGIGATHGDMQILLFFFKTDHRGGLFNYS